MRNKEIITDVFKQKIYSPNYYHNKYVKNSEENMHVDIST